MVPKVMVWVFPSSPCQWRKCTVEKGTEGSVLRIWVQVLVAKLFKSRIGASHWWNAKQDVLRNYLWWATNYLLRQSDRTDAWTTGYKSQKREVLPSYNTEASPSIQLLQTPMSLYETTPQDPIFYLTVIKVSRSWSFCMHSFASLPSENVS